MQPDTAAAAVEVAVAATVSVAATTKHPNEPDIKISGKTKVSGCKSVSECVCCVCDCLSNWEAGVEVPNKATTIRLLIKAHPCPRFVSFHS